MYPKEIESYAGRKLGIDPVEMRRRNAIRTFPHTNAVGVHVDSGDFMGALDKAVAALDYEGFRANQRKLRDEGRYIGVGFSMGIELSGVPSDVLVEMENTPGYGVATVRFDAQGKVQVAEGDRPMARAMKPPSPRRWRVSWVSAPTTST